MLLPLFYSSPNQLMHVAYMGWVLNDRFDSHHERRAELDKDRKEKAEAKKAQQAEGGMK
jgi:hypothetical protein